ncbi:MAG: DUF4142 domain-containing protein [Pseudomonadota bacterium]|nr:DUF4142 domain-containing protein [Pseudomonadota bacterium]
MRSIVLVGLFALGAGTAWAAEKDALDEAQAVGVALMANAAEVPIATSVAARSLDPQVRDYAMMLVQEHSEADKQLLGVMEQLDLRAKDSPLRAQMADDAGKNLGAYWSKEVGAALDQRFMTDTIVQHRDLLSMYDERLIPAATTAAIKDTLTKERATIARHLKEACAIGVKVEAQTAGCPVAEPGTR